MEEKLKLVEENLEDSSEKRRLLKAEKMMLIQERNALEAEKKWLVKQLKLCLCLVIVGLAVMIFFK